MKKILILLALPLLFNSCLKDDEDKFSKSATERIEEAVKEAITVLQGAENGYPEVSDQADGTVFLWVYTECDAGTCYLRNFFLSSSDSIGKSRGSQNYGCFTCKSSARYLVADDPVWKRISGNSSGEIYKTGSFRSD